MRELPESFLLSIATYLKVYSEDLEEDKTMMYDTHIVLRELSDEIIKYLKEK